MALALRIWLTSFGLMYLMSLGNVSAPCWSWGVTPGRGHPKLMLRAWLQGVAQPRMHNLPLLPRLPPTPNTEPMVLFCLTRALVLWSGLRLIYNNNVDNRALLSAPVIVPNVLSFFSLNGHNFGKSVAIISILQVRKLRPENVRNLLKVIHLRGWGAWAGLEPSQFDSTAPCPCHCKLQRSGLCILLHCPQ